MSLYPLDQKWALEKAMGELNRNRNVEVVTLQNDYSSLLQTLFAEKETLAVKYLDDSKKSVERLSPPETFVDKLTDIWHDIFPYRRITFGENKVSVNTENNIYDGSQMSDGERVALYLIGKCLVVPENSVLVIDEPELHLHKALMSRLWNKVEEARNDCQFIYITHDLDFASSRTKAKKIWTKAYSENDRWIWEEVPEVDEIPENLVLEIIGSRKPILFVEGEKGSYDYEIYQYVFPNFTIIPRGGCEKVIESTKALRANKHLHQIEAFSLIDRDCRSDKEIKNLRQSGILCIEIAEIENLLCCHEIVTIVAQNQALNPDEVLQEMTNFIMEQLKTDFDSQVSFRSALEINFRLNAFNQRAVGKDALKEEITRLADSINVDEIYEKNTSLYQKIIDDKNLENALKNYTNKGLLPNMSRFLNLGNREYPSLVLRLLKTNRKEDIVAALKKYIPEIELERHSTDTPARRQEVV